MLQDSREIVEGVWSRSNQSVVLFLADERWDGDDEGDGGHFQRRLDARVAVVVGC